MTITLADVLGFGYFVYKNVFDTGATAQQTRLA